MLKRLYECPVCGVGVMHLQPHHDSVLSLVCKDCKAEIQFGGWSQQEYYVEGIDRVLTNRIDKLQATLKEVQEENEKLKAEKGVQEPC